MWSNPTARNGYKNIKLKRKEFFIHILNQNRMSKTIRFILSEGRAVA
jgi:hypothetical protein